MAAPDEFLFEDSFTEDDWLELVDFHSPWQLTVTPESSVVPLKARVPFAKYKAVIRYLLGTAYVDEDSGNLHRELPAWHPILQYLFCNNVTLQGVKFNGKVEALVEQTFAYASYQYVDVTAQYSQVNYEILEDSQILSSTGTPQEWKRWTTIIPKPYVENLVVPGGSLIWDFDKTDTEQWGGQSFTGLTVNMRAEKSTVQMTVYRVPFHFFANNDGVTSKILGKLNKVNSDDWLGYGPSRWLFDDFQFAKVYNDPVATETNGFPTLMCDAVFTFKFFDPHDPEPFDSTNPENQLGRPSDPRRGWRLLPARNRKYYPVRVASTDQNQQSQPFLYETTFQDLISHWDS